MTLNQRIALALLIVCAFSVPAQAQVSWALADRPDDKIEAVVSRLEPYLEPLPGIADAEGAVLYHQIIVKPEEGKNRQCENLILMVNQPSAMPVELMQPRQDGTDQVVSMSAFVRRGTEYRRLDPAAIVHVAGTADIGRGHFEINWGELRRGDLVGWSLVTESKNPPRFVPIRLGERIPIVLAALQVESNGKLAYEVRSNGVPSKDLTQKKDDVTDGRAMSIKASVNQRAAVDALPETFPWPADYPWMALALKEVRIEAENQFLLPGWAATGGWNQSVMAIGGAASAMAEKLTGVDIALSAVTTGKTTNLEKTEALFTWVRDKFTLLEGQDYDRGGVRDLNEVVKAKEGTMAEKVLLMGALMSKLDIPVTAAVVRTPELGAVDRSWRSLEQFDEFALRTVDDGVVRYWAPQCKSCKPGQVPESWAGAEVLTYEFASVEAAETYQEGLRKKAMVEGRFDLARIQADVEAQPWAMFETIPE